MDDDRTPPSTPRKLTQRRAYDVEDLFTLAVGDFNVALHPYSLSNEARKKLRYWLGRAWDTGRGAAERASR